MVNVFIVNPVAGTIDRTEIIQRELGYRSDIQYILFNTEEAGQERSLVKRILDIFDDEPVRVFICGGSGTLSNSIDAMEEQDFDHVEIGYYPCGTTNDFLKNFGKDRVLFEDINRVIEGEPHYIDFMRCTINGDRSGNELLFSSVGIPAKIEEFASGIKPIGVISPGILYTLGAVFSIPFSAPVNYEIDVDGVDYSGSYTVIYTGNSVCLGGGYFPIKKDIDCRDGYANIMLLKKTPMYKYFKYLFGFMHGTLPETNPDDIVLLRGKKVSVRRTDGKPMVLNSDGELYKADSYEMEIVPKKLKFIVPKNCSFETDIDETIKHEHLCKKGKR